MSKSSKNSLEKKLEVRINKLLSKKRYAWDLQITYNYEFPYGDDYSSVEMKFIQFLKKLHFLWNVQFYYSIKVIKLKKRERLVYFLRMYVTTQNEITQSLHDVYMKLDLENQKLVYDYMDVPRLEKEIDGLSTVLTGQWNESKEVLTDKEMLGLVEEVGDSVKDPVKKVFGRIGNYITDRFSRNRPESEKEIMKRHVKTQANIDSGLKYLDEFANIAMRIGKVG